MFVNSFETRSAASEQGRGDHLPANLAWLQRFTELESNWRAKSKIRWHRVKFHVLNGLHTATLPRRQAFIGQVVPLTQESSSGPAILTVTGQVVVGLPTVPRALSSVGWHPARRVFGGRHNHRVARCRPHKKTHPAETCRPITRRATTAASTGMAIEAASAGTIALWTRAY